MSGFPAGELPRTTFNVRAFIVLCPIPRIPAPRNRPGKSQARGVAQKARRFLCVGFRRARRPRGNRRRGTRTRRGYERRRAALLRTVDQHDVRVLLHPLEHDHAAVGSDVEITDHDVAAEQRNDPIGVPRKPGTNGGAKVGPSNSGCSRFRPGGRIAGRSITRATLLSVFCPPLARPDCQVPAAVTIDSYRVEGITMAKQHPVHALRENLEAARVKAVEALAAKNVPYPPDALQQLASLQAALTAVSEAIATHGPTVGWGSSEGLD